MNKILKDNLEYLIQCDVKAITPDLKDDISLTLQYIDELENKIDKAIEYICFIEHNLEKSEEVGNEGINHFSIALNKVYQLKKFLLKGSEE